MDRVGVRELRQNLSVYLRQVGAGARFEVTERGRPVAVLGPLGAPESALDRLVANGRLTRAQMPLSDLQRPAAIDGPPISDDIGSDRDDRI